MHTKSIVLAVAFAAAGAITVGAQQQPADPGRTPGVQAGADPKRAEFLMANCKMPAAAAAGRGGGGRAGGGAAPAAAGGGGRGAAAAPAEYTVAAIPNVIRAGQRWRQLWTDTGNNADSPIGVADGVLVAQNDKSQIVKIGLDGKVELVATDTYTGGALAMTKDGKLYVGERALNRGIWQVSPRMLFSNKMNGEPLECLGAGVLNDMVADEKGGIYMTMGGVYYTNPQGVTMGRYGVTPGNGLILSKDGKQLYVTGRLMGAMPPADLGLPANAPIGANGGLVAFDVAADGSLSNERQFAWVGGDGTAIDNDGRIYTTGNQGLWVVNPSGSIAGYIPGPSRGLISVAFGGPNKRTLFGVAINPVGIYAIDVQAQGIQNRPK
jgi:hypothetical protein